MAKLIKDIVHGYVDFEQEFIDIINSSAFQRLRNIKQTSYTSLYPSSLHDRFTHSIGVYALGKYAFDHFEQNVRSDFPEESKRIKWENKRYIFFKACLLHDIGHSPFSHTGENFYLQKKTKTTKYGLLPSIYIDLIKCVNVKSFEQDFYTEQVAKQKEAKPHEIMSAIIGIKKFNQSLKNKDNELFARMIIGLKFKNSDFETAINNSLIQLLNSSVIDVDRLDYLARDRTMTGFESVIIDTERLLSCVCLVNMKQVGNPHYVLGYYKNAASVIENVVVAHDSEKKWIQSHAVVLYDSFLVQKCIKAVEKFCTNTNEFLFCEESLYDDGIQINNQTIRLLSDADIIYLAKQLPSSDSNRKYIDEYFSREKRKKAIWKSESEYSLMLREIGAKERTDFYDWIKELIANLKNNGTSSDEDNIIINQQIEDEIKALNIKKSSLGKKEKETSDKYTSAILSQFTLFKNFAEKYDIPYDFVITFNKPFSSNVDKLTSNDVLIKYKSFGYAKPIGEIIKTYTLTDKSTYFQNEKIFFIYYDRTEKNVLISPINFIKFFCEKIQENLKA